MVALGSAVVRVLGEVLALKIEASGLRVKGLPYKAPNSPM